MKPGIYDSKGKLIETKGLSTAMNAPVSAGVTVSSGAVTGAQISTNSNYVGNIVIKDALGNVAIFIGLE